MKGVDLASVQKLMGHADIKTTMIYSHLAPEHLKGASGYLAFSILILRQPKHRIFP